MSAEVFRIESRRFARARKVQTIQHVAAAILLIMAAMSHLGPNSHSIVLPVLELLTAVALIVAAIWQKVRKTHTRVGWLELAGSAMTFIEAIAKLQEPHRPLYHVLTFIPPVILLFFGLFESRIREGFRLEANDDAFLVQTNIFRRRRVKWDGLRTYAIAPKQIVLTREDGHATTLKTTDIENHAAAMTWAEEQFVRRGLVPA